MKIKSKTIVAILMIAVMVMTAIIYFSKINDSFENELKKIGVGLSGVEDFKSKDVIGNKIYAEKEGEIIKIEIVDSATNDIGDDYMEREFALLKSIFEPQLPPYPEFLTKESGCAERYKPIEKESRHGKYFVLYAGERLGYGVCVDDLIRYKASLGYFYCENLKKVFKVEYFMDKKEDDKKMIELNNSFVCR